MEFPGLLVVVPHSGILIPKEIPVNTLSCEFPRLMRNVDWYTDCLYHSEDILGSSRIRFPFCSLILEANRHPDDLDSCIPLKDTAGEALYRPGCEPDIKTREFLSDNYLKKFHEIISKKLLSGFKFMLDAHSTITAKGVSDNQIELMNFQVSGTERKTKRFCPDIFIDTYAEALTKRLPNIKVTVNESKYYYIYGHICGEHSTDSPTGAGDKVPAILQETKQNLYMNANRTPNLEAIETLRRTFAEALFDMKIKIGL